jgi:hypothetical protein
MRPTTRPDRPYTLIEVIEKLTQHFLVEKNPQCLLKECCRYDSTGCAVGCLLTAEDAATFEAEYPNQNIAAIMVKAPALYHQYFGYNQAVTGWLSVFQHTHDNAFEELDNVLTAAHSFHSQCEKAMNA